MRDLSAGYLKAMTSQPYVILIGGGDVGDEDTGPAGYADVAQASDLDTAHATLGHGDDLGSGDLGNTASGESNDFGATGEGLAGAGYGGDFDTFTQGDAIPPAYDSGIDDGAAMSDGQTTPEEQEPADF